MNRIFQAEWIKARRSNGVCATAFSKAFQVKKKIAHAELSLTAHGVFVAQLNGARIGADVLAPGWTVYDKRLQYRTYDVTALLKAGENSLSVGVGRGWLFHKVKYWAGPGLGPDEAALLCALTVTYADGSEVCICSGSDWQTEKTQITYNDMYNGETLDLTKKPGARSNAVTVQYQKDQLIPSEGEPILEQERFPGQTLIVTPKGETVIDFGQEITGYVELTVDAPKGTEIRLQHFEVLDKDGNVYTENLRSAKAIYTVISGGKRVTVKPQYTFYGFRYIQVIGLERPDPKDFTGIAVYSGMKRTGQFACADPLLNRFYENVVWGQKGNFLDVPTDCPQRDERLGWTGDAEVFCRTAAINFDVRAFFDKWMNDIAADQLDGAVPHVCPLIWKREPGACASPAWADVAVVVPWELYCAYGDRDRLARQLPTMKRWIDFMLSKCREKARGTDAAFAHPWTDGGFGDWLSQDKEDTQDAMGRTDRGLIATAYLAYDLAILIKVYRLFGKDPSYYEYAYEHAVAFFRAEYMENGRMKQDTQTAAVLALVFGLTDDPAATGQQLIEDVKRHGRLTTGFVGSTYLLDALTMAGADELAVDLLLNKKCPSWLYPVTMGATTVWERWDGIFPDGSFSTPGMNSFNHYAYGSVFSWMFRRLVGINPVETAPGYQKIRFAPAPDARIPWANASIETDFGVVAAAYKKTPKGWRFTFTVPDGCAAEAVVGGKTHTLHAGENTFLTRD